jgi:hypothetical protein
MHSEYDFRLLKGITRGRYAAHPPIDPARLDPDDSGMSTIERNVSPPELRADAEAVIASAMSGRPVAPEVARRVSERSQAFREESARRHGVREIAVGLIREIRDEA